MSPLALVLALATPAPAPPAQPAPRIELRLAPPACPDIDPAFVRHVPGPSGTGPLWRIERSAPPPRGPLFDPRDLDFGPAVKGNGRPVAPPLRCPRLVPVGRLQNEPASFETPAGPSG